MKYPVSTYQLPRHGDTNVFIEKYRVNRIIYQFNVVRDGLCVRDNNDSRAELPAECSAAAAIKIGTDGMTFNLYWFSCELLLLRRRRGRYLF